MKAILQRFIIIVIVAVVVFAITGCDDLTGGNRSGENKKPVNMGATQRYETVPYQNPEAGRSIIGFGDNNVLIYAGKTSSSYYYVILLGHVNRVPVAYRQAIEFNGITPMKIGYSVTDVTTETTGNAVNTAQANSVTNSTTEEWSASVSAKTSFLGLVSAGIQEGYSFGIGSETMQSRSTANTFETAYSKTQQVTDTIEATIGLNGEAEGKYRFSLFCTTDVYYVVETNTARTIVKDAYIAVCARPLSYVWGIDYEPDLGGFFGKTAPGDLLGIPNLVLSELPVPDKQLQEEYIPPPQKVATPAGTISSGSASSKPLASGTYDNAQTIILTCDTPGASIIYTLDGTTPTASHGNLYISSGITLQPRSSEYNFRAVGIRDTYTNSNVLSADITVRNPFEYTGSYSGALNWLRTNVSSGNTYTMYIDRDETIRTGSGAGRTSTYVDPYTYGGVTDSSVTIIFTANSPVTIDLDSRDTGRLLQVSRCKVVLGNNITLKGHSNNCYALVKISGVTTTLEMRAGSTITGNTNDGSAVGDHDYYCGGVYIFQANFNMTGGTISNNTANYTSGGASLSRSGGAGVLIDANTGQPCNFTMSGGTISGNKALNLGGGGVWVQTGRIVKTGGTIYGNEAGASMQNTACTNGGAAIWVASATTGNAKYKSETTVSGSIDYTAP